MRNLGIMLAGGITLATAAPATAGEGQGGDRLGANAIFAGDYAAAAHQLEAQRRLDADNPELMLNLATAYSMAGRTREARALYVAVLDRPVADMGLRSGDFVSSHVIAERGLARLPRTIAAR